MSGPDYPPAPAHDSNVIGEFKIGVSPIGVISPFDFWTTVISQYANSPILTTLISNCFQYLDQTYNMDQFFDLIWNIDTAQGIGLDIWGRIVGVSRTLQVETGAYLGFEEPHDTVSQPFNQAPFYSGGTLTSNYLLSDDAYRTLILAKAFANICDGSIPAINQLLINLFPGRGNAYVTDEGGMEMTYTFNFTLSPVESAIVFNSGVLPKPVGVKATVVENP